MRKYFVFLLSVVIIGITGFNTKLETVNDVTKNQESKVITQTEAVEDETVPTVTEEPIVTEQPTETEAVETETVTETETQKPEQKKEAPKVEPKKEPEKETLPKEEDKKKEQPKKEDDKEKEPEKPKPEEKSVGYNANNVVSLAIAKCEAGGMITTEHNLKNLLDQGKITKEEYNEYYPLDGLEDSYYSVFVNIDLNKAATTSGRLLGSEEGIADYIAGMLLLESNPIFNIRNVGTYKTGGETFYEFRCYR